MGHCQKHPDFLPPENTFPQIDCTLSKCYGIEQDKYELSNFIVFVLMFKDVILFFKSSMKGDFVDSIETKLTSPCPLAWCGNSSGFWYFGLFMINKIFAYNTSSSIYTNLDIPRIYSKDEWLATPYHFSEEISTQFNVTNNGISLFDE